MENSLIPSKKLILPLLFLGLTYSCKEDPPPEPAPPATNKVIIANAGLPASGTGTISAYNPREKVVEHNVFYKTNTYVPGNSLHSIYVDGNRSFLVMAGTGEILVVDTETMKLKKRIEGLGSPRRMLKITENKFYVSDWQEQGIWVLNVSNGKLIKSEFTGQGPENMVRWKNLVFVANSGAAFGDSTLSIFDAAEDTLMMQLQVAHNPKSLLIDQQNFLWVLCSGIEDQQNPLNSTPGALLSFDLNKDSLLYYLSDSLYIRDTLIFSDNQLKPQNLVANASGNIFYFLDSYRDANLMRFDKNTGQLPVAPHIMGKFNTLGYDKIEKELYLTDPKDHESPGDLYRFDENGGQVDLIQVGVKPADLGFR